jgi:hypothetical protein
MIDNKNIFSKVLETDGVDFYYNKKTQIHDFRPWHKRFFTWMFDWN